VRSGITVPPEVSGRPEPGVGLVTFTIGGNDVLFSKVVPQCYLNESACLSLPFPPIGVSSQEAAPRQPFIPWAHQTLLNVGRADLALFRRLRQHFPSARIIDVGFPYLFPTSDRSWRPDYQVLLSRIDERVRTQLDNLELELNNLAYEAAVTSHIEFVSTVAIWQGHSPCGGSGQWTNSVKPYLNFPDPVAGGTFHPNAAGQQSLAALVACYLRANPQESKVFSSGPVKSLPV
jgi:hypothetical protein